MNYIEAIYHLRGLRTKGANKVAELLAGYVDLLESVKAKLLNVQELNMSNYTEDQVAALNTGMTEVYQMVHEHGLPGIITDTMRIEFMIRHARKVKVEGGSEDGDVGVYYGVGGNEKWTLREIIDACLESESCKPSR